MIAPCRVSEPCGLKVRHFLQDQGYWVLDFTVKGGKRDRVAISVKCQLAIERDLERAGHGGDRGAFLFQHVKNPRANKPMQRRQFDQLFRKYAKLAKVAAGNTPQSARAIFDTEA